MRTDLSIWPTALQLLAIKKMAKWPGSGAQLQHDTLPPPCHVDMNHTRHITCPLTCISRLQEGWIDSATFRDLPYDYATLLENLLDVGHVPFTHHASVSKRSSADVIKLDMKTQGPTGFTGRNERGPRKGQLG